MEEYKTVLSRYAEFNGRSGRREYWIFVLVNLAIASLFELVGLDVIGGLYSLFVLVPSIAVGIRRLHDTGRSGKWFLIALIPLLGWIWIIILMATPGQQGPNQYGDEPQPIEVE